MQETTGLLAAPHEHEASGIMEVADRRAAMYGSTTCSTTHAVPIKKHSHHTATPALCCRSGKHCVDEMHPTASGGVSPLMPTTPVGHNHSFDNHEGRKNGVGDAEGAEHLA
jgi:hypothetical protein